MLNVEEILADGHIDAQEVKAIETEILADGVISREEADMLFALKDGAESVDESFGDLFVNSIKAHVMADGVIDEEEIAWLKEKISADGEVDELEARLVSELGITL